MRRKDREITEINEIISILDKCDCCRIAMFDNDYPYIVPMNFGLAYENNKITLYFHCAKSGQKLDLLNKNPNVCFEMDCSHRLITGEKACDYTMEYESVIGRGKVSFEIDNKAEALNYIMKKFSQKNEFEYDERELNAVCVFKIEVINISAKRLKR